jgi:hypothetical protein
MTADRGQWSDVAMKAVATLVVLVAVVLPAAAEPLRPALKQAQCPVGSMQSGGYCTPLLRSAPSSAERRGIAATKPARSEKSAPAISICAKCSIRAKHVVERDRAAAAPRRRFDGSPIFRGLLAVAVPAAPIGPRCERAFTPVFAG